MKLLLSQKNELFKIVEKNGYLTPGQFILTDSENEGGGTSINLRNSDYSFKIFEDNDYAKAFFVNYIPGLDTYKEVSSHITWDEIKEHFCQWTENLTRQLNEPNRWERLQRTISSIDFSSSFDNSNFTVREYEELKSKVDILSRQLVSIPLLIEQQTEILGQLERLTVVAKDLGKFDWQNLFLGTIISITIQLNVTKENAALLWTLIRGVFSTYFLK